MYCNYKIYFNDSYVLITCDRSQINKNFAKVLDTPKDIKAFLQNPAILFDGKTNTPFLIFCDKPGENMCNFLDHFDIVVAGGGIVTNERDELLLMHRRGKWDLPKGKIELKEEIQDGAIREVI
ncbi:MAG: hydrolase, partial [Bacteroidota bacterium]|nr:hydrolase [Bacteroidota bacterium]